jgi:hypothetical protein
VANTLEMRQRRPPEPAALQLTRRADLLELDLPPADLSLYDRGEARHEDRPDNAA